MNKLLQPLMLILLIATVAARTAQAAPLQVLDMRLLAENGKEQIDINLSAPVQYHAFLLQGPTRLVIDLPPFQWRIPQERFSQYNGKLIRNIRYARFDAQTSRIVLDVAQPVRFMEEKTSSGKDSHINLTLLPLGNGTVTAALPMQSHIVAEDMTPKLTQRLPALVLPSSEPSRAVYSTAPFASIPKPVEKPSENAGLKPLPEKPLIVIDAGHGGQDPGTLGGQGTREKNVTIEYARALKQALINSGKFRAELTREGDYFILLRERIHIAKEKGANLFISLHADSAPSTRARGLSIYTLSEEASDAEAEALAAKENKVDILADVDLSHQDKDVAEILIDLAQRDTKNKSISLAENLVSSLQRQVTLLSNTHRFAGFAVLKAPDIPSALIEIGFLSHPEEERLIRSDRHRNQVVRGIVEGITNYFAQVQSRE